MLTGGSIIEITWRIMSLDLHRVNREASTNFIRSKKEVLLLEHEKKTHSSARRPQKQRKPRKRYFWKAVKGFFFTIFTLCLIGALTAGMIAKFFMEYVCAGEVCEKHTDCDG